MSNISWYVLGSISLTSLPIYIRTTVGKKTQRSVEKCELLSETTFLPYLMTARCVFFYQSVYYFPNGIYHAFLSQQYVSMNFVKQRW